MTEKMKAQRVNRTLAAPADASTRCERRQKIRSAIPEISKMKPKRAIAIAC
jgi:hypothetical protein